MNGWPPPIALLVLVEGNYPDTVLDNLTSTRPSSTLYYTRKLVLQICRLTPFNLVMPFSPPLNIRL